MKKRQTALMVVAAVALATLVVVQVQIRLSQAQDQAIETRNDPEGFADDMKSAGVAILLQGGLAKTTVTIHSSESWKSDDGIATLKADHGFFVVDLSLLNDSGRSFELIPLDQCFVRTSEGRYYRAVALGPEPLLTRRAMKKGDATRGYVCFEVPTGETLADFVWLFRTFPL